MTTATARPKRGFFIGVGCPGCGGDLDLDADFFVTECEHCGSVLRVLLPDCPVAYMVQSTLSDSEVRFHLDRHLKKNSLPLSDSQLMIKRLYYPYWKVDATLLKLRNKTHKRTYYSDTGSGSGQEVEVSSNKSDITVSPYEVTVGAGAPMKSVPDTLGMRSETITILPFSHDNIEEGFDVLPVMRPWEAVLQKVKLALATVGSIDSPDFGRNITRLFDPVFSLIHFPFYIVESYSPSYRRFALDGLTGRVVGSVLPESESHMHDEEPSDAPSIQIGNVGLSINLGGFDFDGDDFGEEAHAGSFSHDLMEIDIDNDEYEEPPEIAFGQLDVDFHRCTTCGVDLPPQLSYVYICDNCHELKMLNCNHRSISQIEVVEFDDPRPARMIPFWWLRLPPDEASRFTALTGGFGQPERLLIPALKSGNFDGLIRLAKRMTAAAMHMEHSVVESLDDHYV
ncbi:MAG: hypothetical protein DRP45_06090, partial [Candidatus Zixiibacteriota bacterium]